MRGEYRTYTDDNLYDLFDEVNRSGRIRAERRKEREIREVPEEAASDQIAKPNVSWKPTKDIDEIWDCPYKLAEEQIVDKYTDSLNASTNFSSY